MPKLIWLLLCMAAAIAIIPLSLLAQARSQEIGKKQKQLFWACIGGVLACVIIFFVSLNYLMA